MSRRLRFLRDFQSRHTGERHYPAGAEAEFDSEATAALLAEGVAEVVTTEVRRGQTEPEKPAPKPKRGRA